jgi:hypothetical protein
MTVLNTLGNLYTQLLQSLMQPTYLFFIVPKSFKTLINRGEQMVAQFTSMTKFYLSDISPKETAPIHAIVIAPYQSTYHHITYLYNGFIIHDSVQQLWGKKMRVGENINA